MKKGRHLAVGIIGAALGLLFYCGSFYVRSYWENRQARQAYDSLRETCLTEQGKNGIDARDSSGHIEKLTNIKDGEDGQALNTRAKQEQTLGEEEIRESFGISWERLREINPETVAWITVPGADISYPVVQGEDDEFYLHHAITKETDAFGTIFLGSGNKKDFSDSHSFLYGHNMEGNMMFANLNRYEEKEFQTDCPEFYIITPKEMAAYEIFSVEQAAEQSPGFQYGYALGSKAYTAQLRMLEAGSMYDTGAVADAGAPMVTLVTCNSRLDEYVRMTIHGIRREVQVWKEKSSM